METTAPKTIAETFAAQQASRWRLAAEPARERKKRIARLLEWTETNADALRQACADDFRKPPAEVDLSELYPVYTEARHAKKHLAGWMKPKGVWPTLGLATTRSQLHYEPKGVCLVLSPWNYPFNLTICPLISAIAAGNAVMLKPSEMTPHVSALLARMIGELFPPDEVALFEGGLEVSQELLALPFDHIFFTGSPKVGKIVMKAAAENLSGVTLELGGKSPVIVDQSAHIEDAAAKVIWGKFLNCGQTCIAPDYVLVHQSKHDEFLAAARRYFEQFYGADAAARKKSPDYARIVNDAHFRRLQQMLEGSLAMRRQNRCRRRARRRHPLHRPDPGDRRAGREPADAGRGLRADPADRPLHPGSTTRWPRSAAGPSRSRSTSSPTAARPRRCWPRPRRAAPASTRWRCISCTPTCLSAG